MDNLDILFLRLGQKNILGHRDPKYMLTVTLQSAQAEISEKLWGETVDTLKLVELAKLH